MEVIVDCERMKHKYTGLFEYCHQLSLALLNTKDKEDRLDVYIQEKDQHYFPDGVRFIKQRSLHKFIFPKLNDQIDIWHSTHQTSWYMPPMKRNVKRVLTIHDLNFLYEEKSESKRASYLKKHQINIDQADHIIAISEYTKKDVLKHLKVSKPITVIYNGANIDHFPGYDQPAYRPQKPFLFTLGTVNAKKNFHVLACLLENRDLELVISGRTDSSYVSRIMSEAAEFNVQGKIKITGPISKEDKYWYYKNCDAFLFPSIAEGFGIPVIEAMNFGKPVFISKATCLPEIGGNLAYYFENFDPDHMNQVFEAGLKNFEDNQPAEAIIKHAQQFNWNTSAQAYWKVYKSLM